MIHRLPYTRIVLTFFFFCSIVISPASAAYKDVDSGFWGSVYINTLSDKGIVNGYGDGTFQPNKQVNRAEFLKLLMGATGVKLGQGSSISFSDTDKNSWYAPYVEAAVTRNIARGYDDGKFRPETTVNRAEALKMLLRLKLDMDVYTFDTATTLQVKDADEKSWYGPYVNAAMKYHLIDKLLTSEKQALPGEALTRAEAAYLIYQLQFAETEFAMLPLRSLQNTAALPSLMPSSSRPIADAYTLFTLGGASLIEGAPMEQKIILELTSGKISTAAFANKKTVAFDDIKQKMDTSLLKLFQKYQVRTITALQNSGMGAGTMFEIKIASGTDASAFVHDLQSTPSVLNASLNASQTPLVLPNDPYLHSRGSWWMYNGYDDLWGLKKVNAPAAWENTTGDSELVVAIIDTGIEKTHPDLKNRIWHNTKEIPNNGVDDDKNGYIDDVDGWNFIGDNNDIQDENGHGTHIAGIVGAEMNNASGVSGVNAKSKLMILKVFDEEGAGNSLTTAKAIKYAADNGAKVINLSLAGESTRSVSGKMSYDEQMLLYAYQKGVTIISAAGNQAIDIENVSPANYPYTIAIAATEPYDTPAEIFSNFGKKIDLSAPGADILSTFAPDGYLGKLGAMQSQIFLSTPYTPTLEGKKYAVMQGTSMAAGYVTGAASLLLSKYPALQPEAVRSILRLSASDIGKSGFDVQTGMGRLDIKKALDIAQGILEQKGFVSITSPEKGSTVSGVQDIVASVSAERSVASWKLSLKKDNNVSILAEGKNFSSLLTSFDTKKISDGAITLSFEAQLSDGTILQSETSYTVENISIREQDTPMPSQGETLFSGTSNLPLARVDVTRKLSTGESKDGFSSTLSSQGFVVKFRPNSTLNKGDTEHFHFIFTAVSGLVIEKDVTRTVGGNDALFLFSDTTKSCSVNSSCKNVPENGYVIEYGEKKNKALVVANHAEVYLVASDGKMLPGWPQKITSYLSGAPLFVNIKNAQGQKTAALVALDDQGKLHAWDISGNPVSPLDGKQINAGGGYLSALDRDNDGIAEFFLLPKNVGGDLGMFDAQGNFMTGWPYVSSFANTHGATIGDMNGDGSSEIFFGDDQGILYAFSLQGKPMSGWPRQVKGKVTEIQLSDLNKDGKLELIVLTQYPDSDKTPKIGLYLLQANGSIYGQGDQEFTGIIPAGGGMKILDERMIALAIDGYSPLQVKSKIVFLDTTGGFLSEVPNSQGRVLFGPMTTLVDNKNDLSILLRNEDQALKIIPATSDMTVLGTLPKSKDADMRDIPLCPEYLTGCIPTYVVQSGAGISITNFALQNGLKPRGQYPAYNLYRNYNAHLDISLPVALVKSSKDTGQKVATFSAGEMKDEGKIFSLQASDLPDFQNKPSLRLISRTHISDPYEFSLTRISPHAFEFHLPFSVDAGIYEVQIGDLTNGFYSLSEYFTVDTTQSTDLSVKEFSPAFLTQYKKQILTVKGNGFTPYHEYALHIGTMIFRDGIEVVNAQEMRIPVMMNMAGTMVPVLEDISQGASLQLSSSLEIRAPEVPSEMKLSAMILPTEKSGFITIQGKNLPEQMNLILGTSAGTKLEIFQTRRNSEGTITAVVAKYPVLHEAGTYTLRIKTTTGEWNAGTLQVMNASLLPSLTRTGKIPEIQKLSTIQYTYSGSILKDTYRLQVSSDNFTALFPIKVSGKNIISQILLPEEGIYTVALLDETDTEVASDMLPLVLETSINPNKGINISRFAPSFAMQGDTVAVRVLGQGMNTLKSVNIGTLKATNIRILDSTEIEAYFVIPGSIKEGFYPLDLQNTEGVHTVITNGFEIKKKLIYVQPVITKVTPLSVKQSLVTIIITGSNFPAKVKATAGSNIQSSPCEVTPTEIHCAFDLKKAEQGRYALRFEDMDTGVVYDTGNVLEVKSY